MGWQVDVDFRSSSIHGIGVFARRPIPAGTRIWQVDDGMHVCTPQALAELDPAVLKFALHGGYLHKPAGKFLWYNDGMQFMNHQATPLANVGLGKWPPLAEDHCIALRDIAAGEELKEDYTFWSDEGFRQGHWLYELYRDFCPEHFAFLAEIELRREAA